MLEEVAKWKDNIYNPEVTAVIAAIVLGRTAVSRHLQRVISSIGSSVYGVSSQVGWW